MDSSDRHTSVSNGHGPRVLCIYGSPRIHGNSDRLLDAFAEGVERGGAVAQRVYLRNLKISPCREIYACKNAGRCALQDDMQPLYDDLMEAHAFALASPVMFYGVSAHAKAFIDRCQALWCLKYQRNESVNRTPFRERKGVFLSVGGSKGQRIFEGSLLTFRYFLDTLDAKPWKSLTFRQIDEKGDIDTHPTALVEARELGAELAAALRTELEEAEGGTR